MHLEVAATCACYSFVAHNNIVFACSLAVAYKIENEYFKCIRRSATCLVVHVRVCEWLHLLIESRQYLCTKLNVFIEKKKKTYENILIC